MRIAATTLQNSKTALGAFYRRMRAKLGAASAITATAHKLARIIYRLLRYGEHYVQQGLEIYEQKYRERLLHNLKKTAASLGLELTQKQPLPHVFLRRKQGGANNKEAKARRWGLAPDPWACET